MKKFKALIVIDNLHIGGVATSLYNYLYFVHDRMDCTLLVFNEESIDISKVPITVKILKPSRVLHILGKTKSEIIAESRILGYFRLLLFLIARMFNGVVARNILWPFVSRIEGYDFVLSYAQDDSWKSLSKGCVDLVVKRVTASHKSVMVHCDYQNFGGYSSKQEVMYSRLDSIICVSESCRKSFVCCFPNLEQKTVTCENFTNIEAILRLAKNAIHYDNDKINFVSICRLSVGKGISRAIEAFKELKEEGYSGFTYTIVGDGPARTDLENEVKQYGLSDYISFAGNQSNPYIYLKNASVFLLPSFHEAAPMVFGESEVFGVPILTTDTCSAKELVEDKGVGVVVDNSKQGIKEGLKHWITGALKVSDYNIGLDNINASAQRDFDSFIQKLDWNNEK